MKPRRDLLRLQSQAHGRVNDLPRAWLVTADLNEASRFTAFEMSFTESKPRRNPLYVQLAALTLLSSVRQALCATENEGSPVIPSEVAIR